MDWNALPRLANYAVKCVSRWPSVPSCNPKRLPRRRVSLKLTKRKPNTHVTKRWCGEDCTAAKQQLHSLLLFDDDDDQSVQSLSSVRSIQSMRSTKSTKSYATSASSSSSRRQQRRRQLLGKKKTEPTHLHARTYTTTTAPQNPNRM